MKQAEWHSRQALAGRQPTWGGGGLTPLLPPPLLPTSSPPRWYGVAAGTGPYRATLGGARGGRPSIFQGATILSGCGSNVTMYVGPL